MENESLDGCVDICRTVMGLNEKMAQVSGDAIGWSAVSPDVHVTIYFPQNQKCIIDLFLLKINYIYSNHFWDANNHRNFQFLKKKMKKI